MIYKLSIEAFALTPETRQAFEGLGEDRLLARSKVGVFDGGIQGAIEHYSANPTPQVIIVEEADNDEVMLENLEHLAEVCEPGTRVVIVGHINDIAVYRHLISQGVSDYLVAPVTTQTIVDSLARLYADPSAPPRGRLIAFYGARGGVGASSLAQNVAWHLAQNGKDEVILVDLDLSFGTVGLSFNAEVRLTISDALSQPERLDQQFLERILVKQDDNLQLLTAAADLRSFQGNIDLDTLDKLLEMLRQMAGYVVLDLPHLWAPWMAHVLRHADDLTFVALPDLPNLRDCKNLLDTVGVKRGESQPTRILLNRVDAYKKTQLTAKDFEENLKMAPFMSIPFDPVFGEASNNGQMIGEAAKGSKLNEQFVQLAAQVSGRPLAAGKNKKPESPVMDFLRKAKLVK